MAYEDLREFIEKLEAEGELARIKHEISPILEMTEIAVRAVKNGGKALLFENPKGYDIPVLMNAFGTERRMKLALEVDRFEEIGERLVKLMKFKSIMDGIKGFKDLMSFKPKVVRSGACKEVIMDDPNLDKFPILKCWPKDGGRYITLPVVITKDPETGELNAGMYRMQVFDSKTTGMHWQIHKHGALHFKKLAEKGEDKLEVAVA
ncbi:MAG TPA: menaquinone biosynthesis decarboxylase, partial [Archaeoglobus profundus]|nr:menaquinone biosynthesis decarboxylase [Archaeoglobus profundus]